MRIFHTYISTLIFTATLSLTGCDSEEQQPYDRFLAILCIDAYIEEQKEHPDYEELANAFASSDKSRLQLDSGYVLDDLILFSETRDSAILIAINGNCGIEENSLRCASKIFARRNPVRDWVFSTKHCPTAGYPYAKYSMTKVRFNEWLSFAKMGWIEPEDCRYDQNIVKELSNGYCSPDPSEF